MNNPYAMPTDETVMISFSGGRSSGYMLHQILQAMGGQQPNVHILFANTGKEMPETLDFVRDCEVNFGCRITWLEYRFDFDKRKSGFVVVDHATASRDGEPFAQLIRAKKMLPNVAHRFCTEELKIKTMTRYMRTIGHQDYLNVIGLRADEPRRIAKMRAKNERDDLRQSCAPMNDARATKADVFRFWKSMPFDLRLDNQNGTTPMGNCDMCFMKGVGKLSSIARDFPEKAEWWIGQEDQVGATFYKGLPYRLLPSIQIDSLFDTGIECIGCTD